MAVTEIALLRLHSAKDISSPLLLANLKTAKNVMEKASGFEFQYYHCFEDPGNIFILGAWPSIAFHMEDFLPGQPNQELLALLKDQLTVQWMFHLDVDQTRTALPLHRKCIAIGRHFIEDGEEEAFLTTFEANKQELERFMGGADQVVGGARLDKGYDPAVEEKKTEFVLFTGWDSVEQHFEFAKTEGFQKYSQIGKHLVGTDIKYATRLDVSEEAAKMKPNE